MRKAPAGFVLVHTLHLGRFGNLRGCLPTESMRGFAIANQMVSSAYERADRKEASCLAVARITNGAGSVHRLGAP